MDLWDKIQSHWGWLLSAGAAAAGFLARRHGQNSTSSEPGKSISQRLAPSRIGRWLNAVKENERLRADNEKLEDSLVRREADLKGEQESIARREANWQAEMAEMDGFAKRVQTRVSELQAEVATLRVVQGAASSIASGHPSTSSNPSDATSSPPSPKPST